MFVLDQLMERSQFTMIVIAAVVLLVGLPRKKARYRILAAVLAVLSIAAALQWYASYVVSEHYFRGEAHWSYLVLSAVFVVAAGVLVSEIVALRLFRRLTKNEKTA